MEPVSVISDRCDVQRITDREGRTTGKEKEMGCSTIRGAILAIAVLGLVGRASADTIYLKSGRAIENVDVKKETFKEVIFRQSPNPSDISRDMADVERVEYERVPSAYRRGNEAMTAGAYEEAIQEYQDVRSDSALYQYALYKIAQAHRGLGQFDQAVSAYDELLSEVGDTKFYADALMAKAEILSAQDKADEAKKVYRQLERETRSKGLAPIWEYEAQFRIALLEGKSRRDFESMARDFERKAPAIAAKARLQVGYVLADEGKYPEAIDYFQGILRSKDATDEAKAGAWAGLAQCHIRKEGATEEDFKEATYAALRTVIMYPNAHDAMPRALYFAARGFELMRTENTPWQRRMRNLYDRVIREYGSTEWAEQARKRR